ncbi:MAG: S8 family peptidase [Candidatus Woesearchaeota archaeon]
MKLKRINYITKEDVLGKLFEITQSETYDFYLKYHTKPKKLLKRLEDIALKVHVYEKIPYVGFTVEQREAKELLRYYRYERSALGLDLRDTEAIITSLDVAPAVQAVGWFSRKSLERELKSVEQQWNLSMIGAYQAHKFTKGKKVSVAVIDTGVDYHHPDLINRFEKVVGYNFLNDSQDCRDFNGHGTHVAGIVAGKYTGVAPECQLYALKVLDDDGQGTEFEIIRALEWCIDNKVDIANMSLGSWYGSNALKEMCQLASKDVILVAAAGNDGDEIYTFPASFEGVISVSSVNERKKRSYFSNYNDLVDIAAPGERIYSTFLNDDYEYFSGTSMAAPHVSGVLALYISFAKKKDFAEEVMKVCAEKLDSENARLEFGYGLVRIDRMLDFLRQKGGKNVLRALSRQYTG